MVLNKQGIFAGFAGNGVIDVQVLLWSKHIHPQAVSDCVLVTVQQLCFVLGTGRLAVLDVRAGQLLALGGGVLFQ